MIGAENLTPAYSKGEMDGTGQGDKAKFSFCNACVLDLFSCYVSWNAQTNPHFQA